MGYVVAVSVELGISFPRVSTVTHCFFTDNDSLSGSLKENSQIQIPHPFQMVNRHNTKELHLHRQFGAENIEISCVYHDQTYGEGYDEEEDGFDPRDPSVPMKMVQMFIHVSIGTRKPFLEIVCCAFEDKCTIEKVLLKDEECSSKLGECPYEGPDIS